MDASVLVELTIAGRHRRGADALLTRYAGTRLVLFSAAHALVEATSAIRRLVRQGTVEPSDGRQTIDWLSQLDVALDAPAPRLRRIWSLRDRMSAYDAAYAAAAEALGTPLVTVDTRLLRACENAGITAAHLDEFAGSSDSGA